MEAFEIRTSTISIPTNRIRHIKEEWLKIYTPIVELGKLQIRFNHENTSVELRTCNSTTDIGYLERSVTYIQAIIDGFKPEDAIAIMKFRNVFTESFQLQDVRRLRKAHLSRAVGRIIGRDGRIKESIENFSKCKFILHNEKISLLGCDDNIKIAKDAIGRLIQGAEPSSIFNRLRVISSKIKDKYGCIETIYEDLRK